MLGRKTIFITGAASGIGRATALHFAARDWFVGLADINREGLGRVCDRIGGENCVPVLLDVTDRRAWDDAVSRFSHKTLGRLDLFFNNAGIGHAGPFSDVTQEHAEAVRAVNFDGAVHGIYATLPLLRHTAREMGRAQIVNTGSVAGMQGMPNMAMYSASKFAIRGLTEALYSEFRDEGIWVSQIQPWFLDTGILDGTISGTNQSPRERLSRDGVPVLPAELAAKAVWRLSKARKPRIHVPVGYPAWLMHFATWVLPGPMRMMSRRRISGQSKA